MYLCVRIAHFLDIEKSIRYRFVLTQRFFVKNVFMVISKENVTNRNEYLDLVKSFAIIGVIVGHCIQYGSGEGYLGNCTFFANPLFKFIYSFHMPLFMLVSGYLFAYSIEKRTWKENIKRKIKTLLVPLLAWTLVCFIIKKIGASVSGGVGTPIELVSSYLIQLIFSFWFLWAILYASLIIIFVKNCFKDSNIVYVALILISLFLPNSYNLCLYSFMLPYYIIGYKFNIYIRNGNKVLSHLNSNRKIYILVTGLVFFFLLYFYNYDAYIYTSGYSILNKFLCFHLITNIYRFVIGLVGSLFVLLVIQIINKNNNMIIRFFTMIGKETMGLYIVSGFCFDFILPRITKDFDGLNSGVLVIEVICVLFISHIVVKILQRTNLTNKIFLGAR